MRHAAVFCLFVCSLLHAGTKKNWRDPASGREFALLEDQVTWIQARDQCLAQGMVISDMRLLTDEERKNFVTSEVLAPLNWKTHFAGTPREMRTADLWQTSGSSTKVAGGDIYYSVLMLLNRQDKFSTTVEWKGWGTEKANAVCMSVPAFWFECRSEMRCTDSDGKFPIRYGFWEQGPTKSEANRLIVEHTRDPRWSVTEQKCTLLTDHSVCYRILP